MHQLPDDLPPESRCAMSTKIQRSNLPSSIKKWSDQYVSLLLSTVKISFEELLVMSDKDLISQVRMLYRKDHSGLLRNLNQLADDSATDVYQDIHQMDEHVGLHFGLIKGNPSLMVKRCTFLFGHLLFQDILRRILQAENILGQERVNIRIFQKLFLIRQIEPYLEQYYCAFIPQPFLLTHRQEMNQFSYVVSSSPLLNAYFLSNLTRTTPFTTWLRPIELVQENVAQSQGRQERAVGGKLIREIALSEIMQSIMDSQEGLPWLDKTEVIDILEVASTFKSFRHSLKKFFNVSDWDLLSLPDRKEMCRESTLKLRSSFNAAMEEARQFPGWADLVKHSGAIAAIILNPEPISKIIAAGVEVANTYSTLKKMVWKPKTTNPFLLGLFDLKKRTKK